MSIFIYHTNLRYFSQSNLLPGSVFLLGAISECPVILSFEIKGYFLIISLVADTKELYCSSVKISSSAPSSSIPIEKSLQLGTPLKTESPACHALLLNGTNCIISPSRLMYKWEDTFKSLISLKDSWSEILRLFKKNSST